MRGRHAYHQSNLFFRQLYKRILYTGPLSRQEALEGGNTTFLCDTTPDSTDDEFMILVWYRNNVPIYSFEFPDKEWADPAFNTNGRLKADLYRQPTALVVTALTEDDQALYH
ncbi:hypothetical protein O3G_MSEX011101, partial [Manduca sexta]